MNCHLCSYSSLIPEELFEHLIQVHGITISNTPPQLAYLWRTRGMGQGFYELQNPLTGKASTHQKNSQRNQVIKLFNPNPSHSIEILPQPPEPWQKIEEYNYILEYTLKDEPQKKITISGIITPGYGKLSIVKKEVYEETHFLRDPTIEKMEIPLTLIEEHPVFTKDITYKKWELSFMSRSISKINLIKNKFYGENILPS